MTTGIDPVPARALPDFWVDGVSADVFPVSWTRDGKVDWVQIVGASNGVPGQATLSAEEPSGLPSIATQSITHLPLGSIELKMDFYNLGIVSVALIGALVKKHRIGRYVMEKEYFSPFTTADGTTSLEDDNEADSQLQERRPIQGSGAGCALLPTQEGTRSMAHLHVALRMAERLGSGDEADFFNWATRLVTPSITQGDFAELQKQMRGGRPYPDARPANTH